MIEKYLDPWYDMYRNRSLTLVNPSAGFCNGLMPLGLACLSAFLKQHGIGNITFLDANFQDIWGLYKETDVVGITAVTQNFRIATAYATWVRQRQPGAVIILGGVHVTTAKELPEVFDIGVVGEGEITLLELMLLPEFTPEYLQNVLGICYRENGELKFTDPRPLVKNLDDFPLPDRELMNVEFYASPRMLIPYNHGRTLSLLTSRGCPFSCVFCSTKVHWNRFRAHSAERVVEEMELVINKYNVEILHLFDDLFTANKKRLFKVRDLMVEKGLNKKVRMMCLVRSDTTDDEVMQALKDMNVVVMGAGFESASPRMLKYLKKNTSTVEQHRNLVDLAIKYQIPVMASFLIGNPTETIEDLRETLEFQRSYRYTKMFQPLNYVTAVFPGTEYWDYALEHNIPVSSYELLVMDITNDINAFRNAPLITDIPVDQFFSIAQEFQYETVLKVT
jgi:radical SAM superfamily enzyme YgiQ (UPF0313 family)